MNAICEQVSEQVRTFVHIERLIQLWTADPTFRATVLDSHERAGALLIEAGVRLELEQLAPFLQLLEDAAQRRKPDAELGRDLACHPLGRAWQEWSQARTQTYSETHAARLETGHPAVDAWRRRQICRVNSEAYPSPYDFAPPLFAFELSKGCSRQCWFCAFSPDKLTENFAHTPENQRLWREVLQQARDLFGDATASAALFHSTEPTDNPDYPEFLQDFHDILGTYAHTTMVHPLKDVEWTRRLLRMRSADPVVRDRFSVLSLKSLRDIFRAFTPEDLEHVALALHNPGALTSRNHCGSALVHQQRLDKEQAFLREQRGPESSAPPPQTTLECTIGYLVNMVERSIKLISPCNASERWPLGYSVHAEGHFGDAREFAQFIEHSIATCMPERMSPQHRLAFRADLSIEQGEAGFVLRSRYRRHEVKGSAHLTRLGELIVDGQRTAEDVTATLIEDGMPALSAIAWVDRLFQHGLLCEGGAATAPIGQC